MAFLPIIERELRVALRKQQPVRRRLRVAAAGAGGTLLFFLLAELAERDGRLCEQGIQRRRGGLYRSARDRANDGASVPDGRHLIRAFSRHYLLSAQPLAVRAGRLAAGLGANRGGRRGDFARLGATACIVPRRAGYAGGPLLLFQRRQFFRVVASAQPGI